MTPPDPLRSAAQWLVDIWADNVAIERGSALWEDIQKVRAALATPPPDQRPIDWRAAQFHLPMSRKEEPR